jgi:sulfate/thiosulfate transport system permease protein
MNSVSLAAEKDLQWQDTITNERPLVRRLLIGAAFLHLTLFLFVPLVAIFVEALKHGLSGYVDSFLNDDALAAIRLTLLVAAVAVPLNALFGVAAAWAIAKFEFLGKQALITLIDMPLAVSPVIAGLIYVLLFGAQGWLGPWLAEHDIQIIFALPGSCWRRSSSPSRLSPAS